MSIALTLQRYLDQNVTYEVIQHEPTMSSTRTAEVCHVSGDRVAKAIVLRRDGGYLLAVLPASHHIHLQDLRMQLDDKVDLATEDEIAQLFRDCARGAVPAVGECYGLDVIVDDSIDTLPDVYLEGGDHITLIHLDQGQFARLNVEARKPGTAASARTTERFVPDAVIAASAPGARLFRAAPAADRGPWPRDSCEGLLRPSRL